MDIISILVYLDVGFGLMCLHLVVLNVGSHVAVSFVLFSEISYLLLLLSCLVICYMLVVLCC